MPSHRGDGTIIPSQFMQCYTLAAVVCPWQNSVKIWSPQVPVVSLGCHPSHKTFDLQLLLPARCAGGVMVWNLWEWPTTDCSHKRESTPDTAWVDRNQRLDSPEIQDRTTTTTKSPKRFLTRFCSTGRLEPSIIVSSKASSGNWREQTQRPTAKR